MSLTLRDLTAQLAVINDIRSRRPLDADEEDMRRYLIVAIHDERELVAAYERAREYASDDMTGQDLDSFYDEQ